LLQALVILGHPRPGSLNHAMADAVREELAGLGGSVCYHDLYAERFDPVLPAREIPKDAKVPADIRTHCEQLADADLIVVGNRGLTKHGRFTRETPAQVLRHATCSVLVVDTSVDPVG